MPNVVFAPEDTVAPMRTSLANCAERVPSENEAGAGDSGEPNTREMGVQFDEHAYERTSKREQNDKTDANQAIPSAADANDAVVDENVPDCATSNNGIAIAIATRKT